MAPIPASPPANDSSAHAARKASPGSGGGGMQIGRLLMGALLLTVAAAASGVLTLQQISRVSVPGCGPGSACGQLAASVWGKVPFVDWPVSFLGLAYFLSLLVAWIAVRGREGAAMRWVIRAGALASVVFVGVMVNKGLICPYCLGAHIANLLFVAMVELTGRGMPRALRISTPVGQGLSAAAIMFFGGTLAIAVTNQQVAKVAAKKQEAEFAATTRALLEAQQAAAARQQTAEKPPVQPGPEVVPVATTPEVRPEVAPTPVAVQQPVTPPPVAPVTPPPVTPAVTPQPAQAAAGAMVNPGTSFTGRARWGPEKAAVRIVMFTGYQCTDCKAMDGQVKQVLARWPGQVSFSPKHFPMSNMCNPHMPTNMHANACWAARAAETAGILGGFEGFLRMHNWLYEQGGSFTDQTFPPALQQLGFEPNGFQAMMMSPETERRVKSDIEEGMRYGLGQTPMVFINGVELKGWNAPNSLVRAVEILMATNPSPQGPEFDRPPNAGDKAVTDWREFTAQAWPSRTQPWAMGPATAPVKIQVFGDFQEPNTGDVDRIIREAMIGRDDIRYEFRYYPADQSCNPALPRNIYPLGCRAARAAEAAGQLGGPDVYWRMHEWLFFSQKQFSDENLRKFATSLGLNADALMTTMNTPQVNQAIQGDISIAQRLGMPSIPRVYINGKLVARWNLANEFVIERIIEEAAVPPPDPRPDPSQLPGLPPLPR
jgi:protein-disulfide isomerase/uncharacterized membrane protein